MPGGNEEKEDKFNGGFKTLKGKSFDGTNMTAQELEEMAQNLGVDFESEADANGKVTVTPVATVVVTSEKKSSSKK